MLSAGTVAGFTGDSVQLPTVCDAFDPGIETSGVACAAFKWLLLSRKITRPLTGDEIPLRGLTRDDLTLRVHEQGVGTGSAKHEGDGFPAMARWRQLHGMFHLRCVNVLGGLTVCDSLEVFGMSGADVLGVGRVMASFAGGRPNPGTRLFRGTWINRVVTRVAGGERYCSCGEQRSDEGLRDAPLQGPVSLPVRVGDQTTALAGISATPDRFLRYRPS